VVARLRKHQDRFGDRFKPAPRLVELAEKQGRFHGR
jgi:hypothetical protein